MSTRELYDSIRLENGPALRSGDILCDDRLSDILSDRRLGVSLIIPVEGLRLGYEALCALFRAAEPRQYLYPPGDLHVTAFDFLQGSDDYGRNGEREALFSGIAEAVLADLEPFSIDVAGIAFTRAAGLLCGFDGDVLLRLRCRIREELVRMKIRNDERYESASAHITFCRWKTNLSDAPGLLRLEERLRSVHFGTLRVGRMELVEHDWYNTAFRKRVISAYRL